MKAWALAVTTDGPHGRGVAALFVLAPDRASAFAAAVRKAVGDSQCSHPNCPVFVTACAGYEIAGAAVEAAAEELRTGGR